MTERESQYKEFQGERGEVMLRRDKVSAVRRILIPGFEWETEIRVDGISYYVSEKYEAVCAWALAGNKLGTA